MNLDACTPGQRRSIERVNGPLLVSAGAGSGKTFTLAQRIAYALLPESGPAVSGIDEVLAITFTEKAAAEIKARVKRTLRAEGLHAEALKVDGAWISTIHGMCARILRTHALDLGLDPAFGIVGDAQRADMLAAAIDAAVGDDNDIIARGSYAALFDEYKARSTMPSEPSVTALLEQLLDRVSAVRGGLDALNVGPAPADAGALARELLAAYERVRAALEQAGSSATAERARLQADEAVVALQEFLSSGRSTGAAGLADLAAVVEGCARIGGNFKATVKPEVKEFQAVYASVAQQVMLGLARPRADELVSLAREVQSRYEQAKRAACVLDNDDLLVRTLTAFEKHSSIARRYEQRFKLVMVDEFQDTSQLQIDMISRLAGPGSAHLCTVGDAQQSIYRFRGADVGVYEEHKRAMRSPEVGALYVELTKNFRSHGDVLAFVDSVFGQPCSFGDAFMSLEPNEARPSTWKGASPRIDLVLASRPAGRGTGVTVDDAKQAAARAIAQRFVKLREAGHTPGEMVVLLGRMTRAGVYAQALRDAGFECVVAGGSQFASAPEVRVVGRLAEAVANPANTAALFEVLASDMLRLSADDFLQLSTAFDEESGGAYRCDLDKGFARLNGRCDVPARLAHAVRTMTHAQQQARMRSLSTAVRTAVVESGWMARLESQGAAGLACAANVLKAVRLLEQVEREQARGVARTARAFSALLAGTLKEAPGALSGSGGDVVRIMTIHASKGLEFPIVAVADFADGPARAGKLVAECAGGTVLASLAPGAGVDRFAQLACRAKEYELVEGSEDEAAARTWVAACTTSDVQTRPCSLAAFRALLARRSAEAELAESRRKLYVALTRASEALVVVMDAKAPAEGKPPSYPALVEDIRSALCGLDDFPEGRAELSYGGSEPACFERVAVCPADVADGDAEQACGMDDDVACVDDALGSRLAPVRGATRFFVPAPDDGDPLSCRVWSPLREGVFSYSSIASTHELSPVVVDAFMDDPVASDERSASDADKATGLGSAFHRAAQYAVETGVLPDAARLTALASAYGLSSAQRARLDDACARWFSSATYFETQSYPLRRAEVPFCVEIGGEVMEGEIDLLCTADLQAAGSNALIIDYKTGGTDAEDAETLYNKHLLQARCYAYAALSQGFDSVELRFVRVERSASDGGPQEVRYRFNVHDLEALQVVVTEARNA